MSVVDPAPVFDAVHLGRVVRGSYGWCWLMTILDGEDRPLSVVFNREQAVELHRRLSKALGDG